MPFSPPLDVLAHYGAAFCSRYWPKRAAVAGKLSFTVNAPAFVLDRVCSYFLSKQIRSKGQWWRACQYASVNISLSRGKP